MEGPFDFKETEKLEEEFDNIIRDAKRDHVGLMCEFCEDYGDAKHFTKEGYLETGGKLICDVCF
jgi:hypothetical protein